MTFARSTTTSPASPALLLAASLLLCAGCSTAPSPGPVDGPAASTASPSVPAPPITGTWSSPSCGARTYERRISFDPAGTFVAEDRISPCPPDVLCVWSGIVTRRGTYTIEDGTVETVLLTADAGRSKGEPLPAKLSIDAVGALVEVLPEGDLCVYTRLGT